MRRVNQKTIDLIKRHEGLSLKRYTCPAGYPTIGYGHRIKNGEDIPDSITREHAENLLAIDLRYAEAAVEKLITAPLTDNQFGALVSFVYNLGVLKFYGSTLRKIINAGAAFDVKREFGKWKFSRGKVLPGLVRRREEEAKLYLDSEEGRQ